MKRTGLLVLGIIGVLLSCCLGTLFLFDPRTKAYVAQHWVESPPPPVPLRPLHAFVPDAGTR